jgi:hypothetical protein
VNREVTLEREQFFIPPDGGRAAEAFQNLFSHTDGKTRDGYVEDGCGRFCWVNTNSAFALSVI